MRLLILGGTTEASALARALAGGACPGVEPILSFAGRTRSPVPPPVPFRIGGFGGVAGLVRFLEAEGIDAMLDVTHPFARQMSAHAAAASRQTGRPLAIFTRSAWEAEPGQIWIDVDDAAAAARAIGREPKRVFLTVGRLSVPEFVVAPQHLYIVRSIEEADGLVDLPHAKAIHARGPFDANAEELLMRQEGIEVLVTKNSGGSATEGKLMAARRLGIPVIAIRRPPLPAGVPVLTDLPSVLGWIRAHGTSSGTERGV